MYDEIDKSSAIVRIRRGNILVERKREKNFGVTVSFLNRDAKFSVVTYRIEPELQSMEQMRAELVEAIKRGYKARFKKDINRGLLYDIASIIMDNIVCLVLNFEDVEMYSFIVPTSWIRRNINACIYVVDKDYYKLGLDYSSRGIKEALQDCTSNAILLDIREFKRENKTYIFRKNIDLSATDRNKIARRLRDSMDDCYTVDTSYSVEEGECSTCMV